MKAKWIVAGIAVLSLDAFAEGITMRPGEYELKTELSVAGKPGKVPPRREVHCYTAEQLQNLGNSIGRDPKQDCKVLSSTTSGSTVTFATECLAKQGTTITLTGTVTHTSAESFHSVVSVKDTSERANNPLMQGEMSMDITARRIGECKK